MCRVLQDKRGWAALHYCAELNNQRAIDTLCVIGANINLQTVEGHTPLFVASQFGKVRAARQLLEYGADCNLVDFLGCSPLHAAARGGFVDVMTLLVDAEAELDRKTYHGYTALFMATQEHHEGAVEFLLNHGENSCSALVRRPRVNLEACAPSGGGLCQHSYT